MDIASIVQEQEDIGTNCYIVVWAADCGGSEVDPSVRVTGKSRVTIDIDDRGRIDVKWDFRNR